MTFKTLLVAYDGSEFGHEALMTAVDNSPLLGATVHVISVVKSRSHTSPIVDPRAEQWLQMFKREAEEMLAKAQEIASGAGVEIVPHMVIGDPCDEIIETAKKIGADLIILGSAGKGRTKRLLLGSVSNSVVAESPIATLVVHAPSEKK